MSPMGKYKLVTKDLNDIVVRFTQAAYDKHKKYHPELLDPTFLPMRIVQALQRPHLIIPDYADKYAVCYYYQEYMGSPCRYTKVVVDISHVDPKTKSNIYYIKTAYRPDRIKEYKYNLKAI